MVDEQVSVLIVGGGLVGLSASLLLLHHGIPALLVERHPTTSIHPRLRGVNARTMEIFRELGLEEDIRAAGAELAPSHGMLSGETLTKALGTFRTDPWENVQLAFDPFQHGERVDDLSPTYGCRVTLDRLEPVLLAAARKRGGDLRFNTECVTFVQDDTGVTAPLARSTSGARSQIRADYLIAADGAGSPIRQALGTSTGGRGSLGHLLNILFTADLRDLVRSREFSLCLIKRPEVRGLLTSINNTDRWVFHLSYEAKQGLTPADYPPERCLELLHLALGVPQVNIEIKSILPWECAVRVADDFQHGRILLAGDAAHQMPPWGGHGGNSGVADAHNLAWKLAAVLKGQAAPSLLKTYTVERRPVVEVAAEESARRADEHGLVKSFPAGLLQSRLLGGLLKLLMERFGRTTFDRILGYGYQYRSQAIVSDGLAGKQAELDGHPGARAPHVWVEKQGQHLSTLDLFGDGFVLLTGQEGAAWCEAAREVASRFNVTLAAYRVGQKADLLDPENCWQHKAGIQADGALLVRPDGFVAWRCRNRTGAPQQVLEQVLARLLCREPELISL